MTDLGQRIRTIEQNHPLTFNFQNLIETEELKRKYPEFASGLLLIHEEIEKLNVGGRISLREYPSEAELDQHDHLVTEQLMFVETFVKEKFGSVESFMEWWRK